MEHTICFRKTVQLLSRSMLIKLFVFIICVTAISNSEIWATNYIYSHSTKNWNTPVPTNLGYADKIIIDLNNNNSTCWINLSGLTIQGSSLEIINMQNDVRIKLPDNTQLGNLVLPTNNLTIKTITFGIAGEGRITLVGEAIITVDNVVEFQGANDNYSEVEGDVSLTITDGGSVTNRGHMVIASNVGSEKGKYGTIDFTVTGKLINYGKFSLISCLYEDETEKNLITKTETPLISIKENLIASSYGSFAVSEVAPTPASSEASFKLTSTIEGNLFISIYDLSGVNLMDVINGEYINANSEKTIPLNLSNLASGTYSIVISVGNDRIIRPLIINK